MLTAAAAGIIVSSRGWLKIIKPYQLKRLLVFLDPYSDPTGSGWNIIQSMIAIGSGGFLGKGLLNGTQSSLRFLPANHTDFVFSVIAEELGFLGSVAVLALYVFLIWRGGCASPPSPRIPMVPCWQPGPPAFSFSIC